MTEGIGPNGWGMRQAAEDGGVEAVIDAIYECALVPETWPQVLDRLVRIVDAHGAFLFTYEPDDPRWIFADCIREESRVGLEKFMAFGGMHRLPRIERARALRHPGFVTDHMVFTPEEMEREPFYRDFWFPRGFGFAAATFIDVPTGEVQILSVERMLARGPVEPEVLARMDVLRPHIARAAVLTARLRRERLQATAAALDLVGFAALVMNGQGRVLAANGRAEASGAVRWLARDRVALRDKAADALLRAALGAIGDEAAPATRSFPVRVEGEAAPLVAHVLPVRGIARDLALGSAAVVVFTAATVRGAPPLELVQSLFDLTPAEARVARGVAEGRTLQAIAAAAGVRIGTIRIQLKAVFAKTGCTRQAELAALLGGVGLPEAG
jgi:DNA-binding CsgD family transcriptional regulator